MAAAREPAWLFEEVLWDDVPGDSRSGEEKRLRSSCIGRVLIIPNDCIAVFTFYYGCYRGGPLQLWLCNINGCCIFLEMFVTVSFLGCLSGGSRAQLDQSGRFVGVV